MIFNLESSNQCNLYLQHMKGHDLYIWEYYQLLLSLTILITTPVYNDFSLRKYNSNNMLIIAVLIYVTYHSSQVSIFHILQMIKCTYFIKSDNCCNKVKIQVIKNTCGLINKTIV